MKSSTPASVVLIGASLWLCALPAVAGESQLQTRGYVEISGTSRTIETDSRVNPGNVLDLEETGGEGRVDFNLGWQHEGFRLFTEAYGTVDGRSGDADAHLYQGYLSYSSPSKRYFVRAGKVVPGWGVGQIWNPVRTFENRRDLIFPDQAIEGVLLGEAQVFFTSGSASVLILPPESSDGTWAYGLRASSSYRDLDYSLSLVGDEAGGLRTGLALSWVVGRLTWVGEAVVANRSEATFVDSGGVARVRGEGQRFSYVVGGNLPLPRDFLLVFEHYHDDEAFGRRELDAYWQHLPRNGALYNPFGNGRDNYFLGLSRLLLWRDSSLALNSFYNQKGAIGVLQLKGESQLSESLRLIVSYLYFEESSANPSVNLFGNSLQARLKWSF